LVTAFRRPSLVGAEIAWRWSFGTAALALAAGAFYGFLDGLTVTDRDLMALGSRNQDLIAAAVSHIFQGSGPRLLRALALLLPVLALLWTFAASVGRTVILRALIESPARRRWLSMLTLYLARAVLAACAVLAALGIILFAAWISSAPDADGLVRPDETIYLLILLFMLPMLALFWNYFNSMLSLAPVFVVRSGASARRSTALAARMFREQRASLLGTAALFAVLRIVAIAGLLSASLLAVAAFSAVGVRVTLAALIVVSLGYFVIVDFLYIARLAATIKICGGEVPPAEEPIVPPQSPQPEQTFEPLAARL
jgi:hypothetical protein